MAGQGEGASGVECMGSQPQFHQRMGSAAMAKAASVAAAPACGTTCMAWSRGRMGGSPGLLALGAVFFATLLCRPSASLAAAVSPSSSSSSSQQQAAAARPPPAVGPRTNSSSSSSSTFSTSAPSHQSAASSSRPFNARGDLADSSLPPPASSTSAQHASPDAPSSIHLPASSVAPAASAPSVDPWSTPSSSSQLPIEAASMRIFRQAVPSVVNVSHSRSAHSFSSLDVFRLPQGQASGFIWDAKGHIVTSYHAVKGLAEVKVTLHDHSTFTAKVVGGDPAKDIGVLRLSMPKSRLRDLQPVALGSSSGLAVGQAVWGVGNPHGLDHTLTQGVVSGLGRELPGGGLTCIKGVVQTTAASGHQAGGVLLDAQGQAVGILVSPASDGSSYCPLGFAVPMDAARGLIEQVLLYGKSMRPTLGVSFAPQQVLEQMGIEGVLVLEVPAGSPASQAGLRPTHRDIFGDVIFGDVIVGMEGRAVRSIGDLLGILDSRRPGDRVKVDIVRDNKATSLTVVLGERGLGVLE